MRRWSRWKLQCGGRFSHRHGTTAASLSGTAGRAASLALHCISTVLCSTSRRKGLLVIVSLFPIGAHKSFTQHTMARHRVRECYTMDLGYSCCCCWSYSLLSHSTITNPRLLRRRNSLGINHIHSSHRWKIKQIYLGVFMSIERKRRRLEKSPDKRNKRKNTSSLLFYFVVTLQRVKHSIPLIVCSM